MNLKLGDLSRHDERVRVVVEKLGNRVDVVDVITGNRLSAAVNVDGLDGLDGLDTTMARPARSSAGDPEPHPARSWRFVRAGLPRARVRVDAPEITPERSVDRTSVRARGLSREASPWESWRVEVDTEASLAGKLECHLCPLLSSRSRTSHGRTRVPMTLFCSWPARIGLTLFIRSYHNKMGATSRRPRPP